MKIGVLFYSIKQGIKGLIQNRMFSLASIGTITACLFLFGIFYFLTSNFQFMMRNVESTVGITVFFEQDITQAEIDKIGEEIRACKDVERVEFVSAEDAWKQFSKEVFDDNKNVTETFENENPLENSASYNVYLDDISNQQELVNYIEEIKGVRLVNSSAVVARSLNSFNLLVGYVSASIIIILLAVAIFLISTTVSMGIEVRKQEISIMKLMGATDFFVRTPFIVEGIVIGLLGAVLPLGLLFVLYENVIAYVTTHFSIIQNWLTFVDSSTEFRVLVPLSLIVGIGIGFFGSLFTVKKHLNA